MMCTIVECESIVEKPNELAAKVVDSWINLKMENWFYVFIYLFFKLFL